MAKFIELMFAAEPHAAATTFVVPLAPARSPRDSQHAAPGPLPLLNRRLPLPLKTLNPPSVRRLARIAALARIKELQDVNAALLRMKEAALAAKSAKASGPKAAKRRKKTP